MTAIPTASVPSAHADNRDCAQLRRDLGWSRAEYRACRGEEVKANIARLDAQFAEMKAWLQARGLDVNDAGHITDPQGRTLAQIEASNAALAAGNAELAAGNAELAAGNAELAAGNAALRARIEDLELRIQTADAEYQRILKEFSRTVLQSAQ